MTTTDSVQQRRVASIERLCRIFRDAYPPRTSYGTHRAWAIVFASDGGYYLATTDSMHSALDLASREVNHDARSGHVGAAVAIADLDGQYLYPVKYRAEVPDGSGDTFDEWCE